MDAPTRAMRARGPLSRAGNQRPVATPTLTARPTVAGPAKDFPPGEGGDRFTEHHPSQNQQLKSETNRDGRAATRQQHQRATPFGRTPKPSVRSIGVGNGRLPCPFLAALADTVPCDVVRLHPAIARKTSSLCTGSI
jgi:hypothetical protein